MKRLIFLLLIITITASLFDLPNIVEYASAEERDRTLKLCNRGVDEFPQCKQDELAFAAHSLASLDKLSECQNFNILTCDPTVCISKSKYTGMVYHVVGVQKNHCHYMEYEPETGGVNCLFPMDELEFINKEMQNYHENIDNTTPPTYFKHCALISPNTILKSNDAQLSKALSEQKNSSTKENVANMDHKTDSASKDNNAKNNIASISFDSVAFTDNELTLLQEAIGYGKIGTSNMNKDDKNSYHLNSIVYYNDSKWSIWLNGLLFHEVNHSSSNLNIVNVTPERAEFRILVEDINKQSPNWRSKIISNGDGDYLVKTLPIRIKMLSGLRSEIDFILYPNQSFNLTDLSIKDD